MIISASRPKSCITVLQHIPQKSFVDVVISCYPYIYVQTRDILSIAISVVSHAFVLPFCVTAAVMHRRQDKNKQNDGIRRTHRRHH
jgi:hypothetical protein